MADQSLAEAASKGDLSRVKAILAAQPKLLNQPDASGRTALHLAAIEGHTKVVQFLIDSGASVGTQDKLGKTAVHAAAANGNMAALDMLKRKGADMMCRCGAVAAQRCRAAGRPTERADTHARRDTYRYTALHWAAGHGHDGCVIWLLSNGCEGGVDVVARLTRCCAAARGDRATAQLMRRRRTSTAARRCTGRPTACISALSSCCLRVARTR